MSTIVQFECRSPEHLRGGSRHGVGGLVIHHGSVGYCDGVNVEGAHHWVPTGGVPIEYILDALSARRHEFRRTDPQRVSPRASGARSARVATLTAD